MSQQNAQTPREFVEAVERYFDVKFVFDLACTRLDCVVRGEPRGYFFDDGVDSLQQDWSSIHYCQNQAAWLNPPWKHIKPWAKKCSEGTDKELDVQEQVDILSRTTSDVTIWVPGIPVFSLFPAGVGSDWFADYVLGQAAVYCLSPRITFLDPRTGLPFVSKKTGKPQTGLNDCILVDWACTKNDVGVYAWKWKEKASRKGVKRGPRKKKGEAFTQLVESMPELNVTVMASSAWPPDGLNIPDSVICPPPVSGDQPPPTAVSLAEISKLSEAPTLKPPTNRDEAVAILQSMAAAGEWSVPELVQKSQAGDFIGTDMENGVNACLAVLSNDDPILEETE